MSNNSCSKRDIVGSAVLAILLGKTRYVHINELRHDESARRLLGLGKIVSEDSVRRALKKASEADLDAWLAKHERRVYEVMLAHPYIVDSIAEQLTREKRWLLTIVYAFRAILLPDPVLKTVRLLQ